MCYSHHEQEVGLIPERVVLFLILVIASLCDISCYRVPNMLFVPAFIFSLFRHFSLQGFFGIIPWLAGAVVPFILCYTLYRCRMLGASDSKMYSVIGSFVGLRLLFSIMAVSLVLGAAMAIGKMIFRNNFRSRFRRLFNYVCCCVQEKKMTPYYDRKQDDDDGIIPFIVAISLAVLFCAY